MHMPKGYTCYETISTRLYLVHLNYYYVWSVSLSDYGCSRN